MIKLPATPNSNKPKVVDDSGVLFTVVLLNTKDIISLPHSGENKAVNLPSGSKEESRLIPKIL